MFFGLLSLLLLLLYFLLNNTAVKVRFIFNQFTLSFSVLHDGV